MHLSPYIGEPLNSKVIKSFVPELRSRVFRVSRFLCFMYIFYEHSMYISHIRIWLWYNGPGTYLSFRPLLNSFCDLHRRPSPQFGRFFLLTIIWSSRLAEIMSSVCISKFQINLCVSFSRPNSGLCIYHLFVWSNLRNSQWITSHPVMSIVYSFCANLLYSLIM